MISFNIQKPDTAIATALQDKINNLTKPKGSLIFIGIILSGIV